MEEEGHTNLDGATNVLFTHLTNKVGYSGQHTHSWQWLHFNLLEYVSLHIKQIGADRSTYSHFWFNIIYLSKQKKKLSNYWA